MKLTHTALLLAIVSLIPLARAGEITSYLPAPKAPQAPLPASWKWSLAPLVASQALDITSSYGMRELNPVLSGPQGQFGAGSVLLKVGVTAGLIGVECLIVKVHPGSARVFAKINWAAAAVTTGLAVHNFSIR
jgi:hypothetical protein